MIEYNSETANKLEELHPTIKTPEPTIEELKANVELLRDSVETWRQNYYDSQETIEKARKAIEDVLAGDLDPATTFEEFREAFELLGVKATREVEIEISVTWRGTIELPLGVEVDDLDVDDFGISIDGHHEYEGHINNYFEDSSIDER